MAVLLLVDKKTSLVYSKLCCWIQNEGNPFWSPKQESFFTISILPPHRCAFAPQCTLCVLMIALQKQRVYWMSIQLCLGLGVLAFHGKGFNDMAQVVVLMALPVRPYLVSLVTDLMQPIQVALLPNS
jgi:hypothetical protein